jgi:hypothetical protein
MLCGPIENALVEIHETSWQPVVPRKLTDEIAGKTESRGLLKNMG